MFSEAERVLERSIEFVLLDSVLEEIRAKLAKGGKTEKRMFSIALDLAKRCRIIDINQSLRSLPVDDQILIYVISVNFSRI